MKLRTTRTRGMVKMSLPNPRGRPQREKPRASPRARPRRKPRPRAVGGRQLLRRARQRRRTKRTRSTRRTRRRPMTRARMTPRTSQFPAGSANLWSQTPTRTWREVTRMSPTPLSAGVDVAPLLDAIGQVMRGPSTVSWPLRKLSWRRSPL